MTKVPNQNMIALIFNKYNTFQNKSNLMNIQFKTGLLGNKMIILDRNFYAFSIFSNPSSKEMKNRTVFVSIKLLIF